MLIYFKVLKTELLYGAIDQKLGHSLTKADHQALSPKG